MKLISKVSLHKIVKRILKNGISNYLKRSIYFKITDKRKSIFLNRGDFYFDV